MDHSNLLMAGTNTHEWEDARTLLAVLLLWIGLGLPTGESADEAEFFEKRVGPVLAKHCYQCHSADAKKLKAELYVDSRSGLIVPGKP